MPLQDSEIMTMSSRAGRAYLGFMPADALISFYRGPELLCLRQLMNIQQYFPARQAGPGRGFLHYIDKKSIVFSLDYLSLPIQSALPY